MRPPPPIITRITTFQGYNSGCHCTKEQGRDQKQKLGPGAACFITFWSNGSLLSADLSSLSLTDDGGLWQGSGLRANQTPRMPPVGRYEGDMPVHRELTYWCETPARPHLEAPPPFFLEFQTSGQLSRGFVTLTRDLDDGACWEERPQTDQAFRLQHTNKQTNNNKPNK